MEFVDHRGRVNLFYGEVKAVDIYVRSPSRREECYMNLPCRDGVHHIIRPQ